MGESRWGYGAAVCIGDFVYDWPRATWVRTDKLERAIAEALFGWMRGGGE